MPSGSYDSNDLSFPFPIPHSFQITHPFFSSLWSNTTLYPTWSNSLLPPSLNTLAPLSIYLLVAPRLPTLRHHTALAAHRCPWGPPTLAIFKPPSISKAPFPPSLYKKTSRPPRCPYIFLHHHPEIHLSYCLSSGNFQSSALRHKRHFSPALF